MKQKILLSCAMALIATAAIAQQETPVSGYAITAPQKGLKSWKEVRQVNVITGDELKTIYRDDPAMQVLNARTKKPISKTPITPSGESDGLPATANTLSPSTDQRVVVSIHPGPLTNTEHRKSIRIIKGHYPSQQREIQRDKPFATSSAALAYDNKNDRLYYTPLGINELRYIDLKNNKVYFFEMEAFGVVKGPGDVSNQFTRMVFGADGKGYALTNNAEHLVQFTTGKKPVIMDLGKLSDDPSNGSISIHDRMGYGGDLIADAFDNLYLVTANRRVFRISLDSRVATYLGIIKGLPQGFSTNGAMVEGGSKVIVASSEFTSGYYRFDLTSLEAEKASTGSSVYNASDLANGILAFAKEKKNKNPLPNTVSTVPSPEAPPLSRVVAPASLTVYPNPVTDGVVKISFNEVPEGRYLVQVLDVAGQVISSLQYNVNSRQQVTSLVLPDKLAKGTYFIKLAGVGNNISTTTKLVVQ